MNCFKTTCHFVLVSLLTFNFSLANDISQKGYKKIIDEQSHTIMNHLTEQTMIKTMDFIANPEALIALAESKRSKNDVKLLKNLLSTAGVSEALKQLKVVKDGFSLKLNYDKNKKPLVLSLEEIVLGKITLDGTVINFENYQDIQNFIVGKYSSKTSQFQLLDLIIPRAYAEPITAIVVGIIIIGALAAFEALFTTLLLGSNLSALSKTSETLEKYEDMFKTAINQCDNDLEEIKQTKVKSSLSNNTLEFMSFLEDIAKEKVTRFEKKRENILSCEHIKASQGITFYSAMFHIPLFKRVGDMCDLGEQLEACLSDTKIAIKSRGININQSQGNKHVDSYEQIKVHFSKAIEQ